MNERTLLIIIHAGLFILQIGAVAAAIGINSLYSGLSLPISAAQSFFPNPFKQNV